MVIFVIYLLSAVCLLVFIISTKNKEYYYYKKAQLMQGLRATAVRLYEDPYSRQPSSAGNPAVEPNIMSLCCTQPELC